MMDINLTLGLTILILVSCLLIIIFLLLIWRKLSASDAPLKQEIAELKRQLDIAAHMQSEQGKMLLEQAARQNENTVKALTIMGDSLRDGQYMQQQAMQEQLAQLRQENQLSLDKINNTVVDMLDRIVKEDKISLLFGTGDRNYESVMSKINEKNIQLNDDVKVVPYIDNMADCMAAADIVIARSGAITVSEIAALSKPSILIPSPNVVRNHQEQNAREFENNGAAAVILEQELNGEVLYEKMMSMVNDKESLLKMSENLRPLAKTDALEKLYELMKKMSDKGVNK